MADLDRIMQRPAEDIAFLVWNGSIIITVEPHEFPKMKAIIEPRGEGDFSDSDDDSFSAQIAHFANGDDLFDHSLNVDEFERFITKQDNGEFEDDDVCEAFFDQVEAERKEAMRQRIARFDAFSG